MGQDAERVAIADLLFDESSCMLLHIQTNKKLRYFTGNDGNKLPFPLEYYHYQLTTVGALFCTAINSELNANACIINGTPMKASKVYTNRIMSYNEL
eukprot:CCRYP_005541-RA/>CCRYP_005541-RA protein AED:0.32 eAED:0.32 QI:0/0/0/1/0/0/2/0/96